MRSNFLISLTRYIIAFLLVCIIYNVPFAGNKYTTQLDSSSDYCVYYSSFGENEVLKAQYFDLIVLDTRYITAEQVLDIRNGFDDLQGTDDDVIVIGYLSIGEQDGQLQQGDGRGPVYWDGSKIVYQNNGYASYYLDDADKNGIPDKNGIWNSYYVNAGDSAWWMFNYSLAEDIITINACDGLFLDVVDTGGPNSWGLPYEWTAEGMIKYIEYLRKTYPDKYILANRGIFYFEPALPNHYKFADRYRSAINGLMIESYYAEWDWDKSVGIYNTTYPYLRDHFAPLLNVQSHKPDGFNMFILDYLTTGQDGFDSLLDTIVKVSERDQGWLTSVSPIYLDTIRFDVFNHHIYDKNPPSWIYTVGIKSYVWNGDSLELYCNIAFDQTPTVKYDLYFSESEIDFNQPPQYHDARITLNDIGCRFVIPDLDNTKTYKAAVRAYDTSSPPVTDPNRKVVIIQPEASQGMIIDGYFNDWNILNQLDVSDGMIEYEGDTLVSPSCDLIDLWFSEDNDKFYFSFSAGGEVAAPPYYYHVFIDEDNNPQTGFHPGGSYSGIDVMIENGYLWRYAGTAGEWNWQYIGETDYIIGTGNDNNKVEMSVDKSAINSGITGISFIFNIDNQDELADDYAPDNYTAAAYHSIVTSVSEERDIKSVENICSVFPNPFNPEVTFRFSPGAELKEAELLIYNITGELVFRKTISKTAGKGTDYIFNAASGNFNLAGGVYLYTINTHAGTNLTSGKMVYLK